MAKATGELKTNAIRLVEQAGIAFELRQYAVDKADLIRLTAAPLAALI